MGSYLEGALWANWHKSVRKRIKSLVLPFLIFCLLGLALKGTFRPDFMFIVTALGLNLSEYPSYKLLWFVRNLFMLVVLAPMLVVPIKLSRYAAAGVVALTFALFVLFPGAESDGAFSSCLAVTFRMRSLFFFALGLAARQWCVSVRMPMTWGLLAFAGGLAAHGLASSVAYSRLVEAVAQTLLVVGGFSALQRLTVPVWLTRDAFAIYLIHGIVMFAFRGVSFWPKENLLACLSVSALTVALSWLSAEALRRFASKAASVAFGGR